MVFITEVSARCHQGKKRPYNEDSVTYFEPDSREDIQKSGHIYVVADGVGRSSKGDLASQYAAKKLLYEYYRQPDIPVEERLAAIIRKAGNDINRYAEESNVFRRMATTLVAAVVKGNSLTVANVGDSRAYLIRDGIAQQLTEDHSLVAEMLRNGTLTPEEAERSSLKNRITRSLGGKRDVKVDVFSNFILQPGDKLLLCSDGLTRYTTEGDLVSLTEEGSPEEITQRLVEYANRHGGEDNISAVLVDFPTEVEEYIPVAPQGEIPRPVDWESLETEPRVQIPVAVEEESPTRRRLLPFVVGGLILLLAFLGVRFGQGILSPDRTPTPVSTITPVATHPSSPSPSPTPQPPSPTPILTKTMFPSPTPTPVPTETLPAVVTCLYTYRKPAPGVWSLYVSLRDIFEKEFTSYQEFRDQYAPRIECVEEEGNPCAYNPENYEWAEPGWVLLLPDIQREKCLEVGGMIRDD